MIPAFIVLAVVACGLGGFIAFTEIHFRKTATPQPETESETTATVDEPTADGDATPTADDPADPPTETETAATVPTHTETADLKQTANKTVDPTTDTETENNSVGRGITTRRDDNDTPANEDDPTRRAGACSRRADETPAAPRKITVRYSKSFLAKLIQSDDQTKRYYSALKNRLLAYGGVQSRIGWRWESFHAGRKTLARLRLRGKTLSLCLALDPEAYADPKYKVENLSSVKAYKATSCMCRIKSDKRLSLGIDLIDALMAQTALSLTSTEEIDYVAKFPYETTETLIANALIKDLSNKNL